MFWEFFIPLKFRKGTKCKKKTISLKNFFSKKNWPIHRFKNISIDVLIQNGSKCHSEFVSSNWKGKKWEDVCTFSVVPLQLVHLYKYSIPYNCRQCTMISSRRNVHLVCFPHQRPINSDSVKSISRKFSWNWITILYFFVRFSSLWTTGRPC